MLDLGASVSVMPLSIFNSLSLGPLQSTNVVIHLANRSVAYPAGFIEDVLVKVGELIFLIDFFVDMTRVKEIYIFAGRST